ncbi:helix-turn-helix domain-containing protein [Rhodococcoides fascians]|uniref:helix-turn-helix domain-containing protein n=1 Tax=Rhodococcoides fascians TaxID=1828 RepID=UPI00068F3465|nr:helix-turn-helix transcriptional regulator [Rhodococcus fascians]
MTYSTTVLGTVIRERREALSMTQKELGSNAGYGAGAGVAISRIEAGTVRPSLVKLQGIARALGTSVAEIEQKATRRDESIEPEEHPTNRMGAKERAAAIQQELERRTQLIEGLVTTFNTAHDGARDQFFMAFVGVAEQIEGAPVPDPDTTEIANESSEANDTDGIQTEAALRQKVTEIGVKHVLATGAAGAATGGAVGTAAAYGAFTAAVSFGTASTGAAISGLSGVAATNAATALLGGGTLAAGGAGIAGGTALLGALVAGPAVILALGGAFWMYRKKRNKEQDEQLDAAEASLSGTSGGVDALEKLIPVATEILDYVAVHAGHALKRWQRGLGPLPTQWKSLTDEQRARYQDFVEVLSCQLSVISINVNDIAAASDVERVRMTDFALEVLRRSKRTVEALV